MNNRLSRSVLLLLTGSLAVISAQGQELPATGVWLARINDGLPEEPERISPATGYNNQPLFSPDSAFVYYTTEARGTAKPTSPVMRSPRAEQRSCVANLRVTIHPPRFLGKTPSRWCGSRPIRDNACGVLTSARDFPGY